MILANKIYEGLMNHDVCCKLIHPTAYTSTAERISRLINWSIDLILFVIFQTKTFHGFNNLDSHRGRFSALRTFKYIFLIILRYLHTRLFLVVKYFHSAVVVLLPE